MFAEWIVKGKPSLLGALVGLRRRSGRGHAGGRLLRSDGCDRARPVAGVVCLFFCSTIKNMFGYDDSLDVFGVHCVGGIVGAIGTGILVNPALGGTGIFDYTTGKVADYDFVDAGASRSARRWPRRWCGRASAR